MERLLLLDIAGVASRNGAFADVVYWVHRDADEGIMCGYAALCSLRGGGVAGIITGKWTNTLCACHLITTLLLQDFFLSGAKMYQELSECKEAVREHPFERLWVDCLIKPSLLALRLLHAHRDGDVLLQKVSLEVMMPCFFAAGQYTTPAT